MKMKVSRGISESLETCWLEAFFLGECTCSVKKTFDLFTVISFNNRPGTSELPHQTKHRLEEKL